MMSHALDRLVGLRSILWLPLDPAHASVSPAEEGAAGALSAFPREGAVPCNTAPEYSIVLLRGTIFLIPFPLALGS